MIKHGYLTCFRRRWTKNLFLLNEILMMLILKKGSHLKSMLLTKNKDHQDKNMGYSFQDS